MSARKRPKSVVVYNKLLKLILDGHYRSGDSLPGEVQLAESIGVSRSTLRQAIDLLCEDGIIERKHGVGNFVKNDNSEDKDNLGILGNPALKCFTGELSAMRSNFGIVASQEFLPYLSYIFSKPSPVVMSHERYYYQGKELKVYVDSLISIDFLSAREIDISSKDAIDRFIEESMYTLCNRIMYQWKISKDNDYSKEIRIQADNETIVTLVEEVFDDKGEVIAYSKYLFPCSEYIAKVSVYNR